MMRFRAFGIAGMALSFFFVSPVPGWALTNSQVADAPEFESVAFISVDAHDPDSDSPSTGYCNGTLLSPSLIATAAHCVSDAITMHSNAMHVEVGNYFYVKRPDGTIVRVGYKPYLKTDTQAQFLVSSLVNLKIQNDGFRVKIGPEEDLAIAVLARPVAVPAAFQFAKAASRAEVAQFKDSPLSFSPRAISINIFTNISTLDSKRLAALDDMKWSSPGFFRSNSSSRVEEGDSGAPLMFKTSSGWVLGGVVKGQGKNFFGDWDAYSPMGELACDIAKQIPDPTVRGLICR